MNFLSWWMLSQLLMIAMDIGTLLTPPSPPLGAAAVAPIATRGASFWLTIKAQKNRIFDSKYADGNVLFEDREIPTAKVIRGLAHSFHHKGERP